MGGGGQVMQGYTKKFQEDGDCEVDFEDCLKFQETEVGWRGEY